MKLTKVSARNFKGLSFDLDLTAGVVLVGPNFAGKSARTDAIRLLLLGYLPELGKTPRATFGLASAREMEVFGFYDDGSEISRRWFLKGDTIKAEFGGVDVLPEDLDPEVFAQTAVMLNAEEYFRLSDRERVAYVFGNLSLEASDGTPVTVLEVMRGKLGERSAAVGGEILAKADGAIAAGARKNVQTYVEELLRVLGEHAKVKRSEAARMDKTIQGLSQLRLRDEAHGPSVAELNDSIAKETRAVAELNEKKGRLQSAFDDMVKARSRRVAIGREVAQNETAFANLSTLRGRLEAIRRSIAAAAPAEGDRPLEELRDKVNQTKLSRQSVLEGIARLDALRDTARRKLAELATQTICPYCGAAGSLWRAMRALELERSIAKDDADEAEFVKTRETLKEELAGAEGALARATDAEAQRQGLAREEQGVLREIARLEPFSARVEALREESDRLTPDLPELTTAVEVLQTELNVKNDELRRLDSRRAHAEGRAAEVSRLAEAEAERAKALEEEEVAKSALSALRDVQARMIEAAFRPLLAKANALFGSVLRSPIAYNEGEIGTWRDGHWVGHRTFSGTEKALTYAAIQIALATKAPFRLMLLDELGRLDDLNARKVAIAIDLALESGEIDQFVGIDAGRAYLWREAERAEEISPGERWGAFNVVEIS